MMLSMIKQIKPRREKLGVSQGILAAMAGISRPHLSLLESDKVKRTGFPTMVGILESLEKLERKRAGFSDAGEFMTWVKKKIQPQLSLPRSLKGPQ